MFGGGQSEGREGWMDGNITHIDLLRTDIERAISLYTLATFKYNTTGDRKSQLHVHMIACVYFLWKINFLLWVQHDYSPKIFFFVSSL